MNPLYRGSSHQLLTDRTIGDGGHPQFALKTSVTGAIALANIFVPISSIDAGAVPDSGALVTTAIQNAFDNATPGDTLAFDNGEYLIDGGGLQPPSGIGIFLSPGTVIKQTNGLAVLDVVGTLEATTTDLGANAQPGEYILQVVDTTGFTAGAWIQLKDDFSLTRDHMELIQIRSVSGGTTVNLYHPIIDQYLMALNAKITLVTPVQDVHIWGDGALTNPSDDANEGKCLRYEWAVNCTVQGIEIFEFGLEAVGYLRSAHCRATNLRVHDGTRFNAASPSLVGYGYGITSASSHNLVWDHNRIWRTRHALDVSFFSRMVNVNNNIVKAQASTAIQTHPDTKHTIITGNVVDGVVGYDATGLLFGGEEGSGIGIRENCDGAIIANNTLRNVYGSGITVHGDGCQDIVIANNVLDRVNLDNGVTHAGIRCYGTQTTNTLPGLVVSGNVISDYNRYGILAGFDDAVITGNVVRNTLGVTYGILIYSRVSGVPVNRLRLTHNTVTGGTFGIMLGGSYNAEATAGRIVNDIYLEGNEVRGTTNEGIGHANDQAAASTDDYCTGGIIKGNRVIDCNTNDTTSARGGIFLADSTAVTSNLFKYDIVGNYVTGSTRTGIRAVGDGTLIEDNICEAITSGAAVGFGIRVAPAASGATVQTVTIRNNFAHDCSTDGIRVEATSGGGATVNDVVVEGNHCSDNNAWGLRIGSGAVDTVILPNWGTGNASGFFTDAGTTTNPLLFTDPVNSRIGIATSAPGTVLDVRGATLVRIDSAAAFEVQEADGTDVLTVDTTGTHSVLVDASFTVTGFLSAIDGEFQGNWLIHGAGDADKFSINKAGPGDQIFGVDTANDRVETSGAQTMLRTAVAASPYNVVARDCHLSVSTAAARTINLPAATATTAGHGRRITINDAVGAGALVNNITIVPAGADTIDQVAANKVLALTRASITLESDGTSNWEIVASHLL